MCVCAQNGLVDSVTQDACAMELHIDSLHFSSIEFQVLKLLFQNVLVKLIDQVSSARTPTPYEFCWIQAILSILDWQFSQGRRQTTYPIHPNIGGVQPAERPH